NDVWIPEGVSQRTPNLIDVAPARPGRGIDSHPLFISAQRWTDPLPGGSAVSGPEQIFGEIARVGDAQIIKHAVRVGGQHGIAAESAWLECAGKGPVQAAIGGKGDAGLAETAVGGIKLTPADGDSIWVGWIDAHRGFVGSVAANVLA